MHTASTVVANSRPAPMLLATPCLIGARSMCDSLLLYCCCIVWAQSLIVGMVMVEGGARFEGGGLDTHSNVGPSGAGGPWHAAFTATHSVARLQTAPGSTSTASASHGTPPEHCILQFLQFFGGFFLFFFGFFGLTRRPHTRGSKVAKLAGERENVGQGEERNKAHPSAIEVRSAQQTTTKQSERAASGAVEGNHRIAINRQPHGVAGNDRENPYISVHGSEARCAAPPETPPPA